MSKTNADKTTNREHESSRAQNTMSESVNRHTLLHSIQTQHQTQPPIPTTHLAQEVALSDTSQPIKQRHLPHLLPREHPRLLLKEPARKRQLRHKPPLRLRSTSNRTLQLGLPIRQRPSDELLRPATGSSHPLGIPLESLPGGLLERRVEGGLDGGKLTGRAAAGAVEESGESRAGELEELGEGRVGVEGEGGALDLDDLDGVCDAGLGVGVGGLREVEDADCFDGDGLGGLGE
jgi:hypothetical protein